MIRKIKHYLTFSLKRQLITYIVLGIMGPLIIVMSILFVKTRAEMKAQAVENIRQKVQSIAEHIEQMIYNIHSVSDHNAYNDTFEAYTLTKYGDSLMEKRRDIQIIKAMFGSSDLLNNNIQMSAVLNRYGELMNFEDFMVDNENVIQYLYDMGVDDKANLSKLIWHPVQNNFLREGFTGNLRKDKVIIGSRRIVNLKSGVTNAVHIFAVPEEEIWIRYKDIITGMSSIYKEAPDGTKSSGAVYIIDETGGIISTSDEVVLEKEQLDEEILKHISFQDEQELELKYQGKKYLLSTTSISNANWRVVAMIPLEAAVKSINRLFIQIIVVAGFCIIGCALIIVVITKRFLAPIGDLKGSMQAVYDGNLDAYVQIEGDGEIQEMGIYYNSMLKQINLYLQERVNEEKRKKQLEMEVIMGQVNPHFLYNTLENIVWKSSEAGHPEIGRMAASLGRLYRLSIGNGKTMVRIRQEIEHLMAYINIQKVRFHDLVEFDLLVDYEAIGDYQTIKLILQPIVENCYLYALEGLERTLKIWVKIKVWEENIRFEVIDNGCGMTGEQLVEIRYQIKNGRENIPDELTSVRKKGTGIGLYSIKERLSIYFGNEDAVKIRSRKGQGTVITVTIPKIRDGEGKYYC